MAGFWDGATVQPGIADALTFQGFAMDANRHNDDEVNWTNEGGDYTSALGLQSGTGGESYGGGVSGPHSCESDIVTHSY